MRHRKRLNALGRTRSHRKAMLRNMITSLFRHERIETSVVKAKEARRLAERLITYAKRGDLHARRQAARVIADPEVLRKLFSVLAERYRARPGGYTRIIHNRVRLGDGSEMGFLELVDAEIVRKEKETDKKGKESAKGKEAAEAAESKKEAKKKSKKKPETAKEKEETKEKTKKPKKKAAAASKKKPTARKKSEPSKKGKKTSTSKKTGKGSSKKK